MEKCQWEERWVKKMDAFETGFKRKLSNRLIRKNLERKERIREKEREREKESERERESERNREREKESERERERGLKKYN